MPPDYDDDNDNLFGDDYATKELFDEEDEEIGSDFHVDNPVKPSMAASASNTNKLSIGGKSLEIAGIKSLPDVFKNQGVVRAVLIMSNGKAVILK